MYCITDIYFYMKIYIILYTIYCMNDTYLYVPITIYLNI